MLDPRTVMVAIPTYSGRVVCELAGSLIHSSRQYGAVSFVPGVSHPAMVRNLIAESFLRSPFEWLVSIDDDIAFHPNDFRILMEPVIAEAIDTGAPTRVACRQLDETGNPESAFVAAADALVTAEYSYKNDELIPCRLGMGFTRTHRSVFETIATNKHEDGSARTWQYTHQGRLLTDFYPCGALVAQLVPGSPWTGEDHGFFLLAKLAGFVPRVETRTQLFHVGTKAYPYMGNAVRDEGAQ